MMPPTTMMARIALAIMAMRSCLKALQAKGRITEGTVNLEEFVDFEILFYLLVG